MPCFKDKTGQSWAVKLSAYDLGRFKDEFGVDDSDYQSVMMAIYDRKKLLTMLWILVEDQASAMNPPIDCPNFLRRIEAEQLIAAMEAVRDAYLLFCQPRIGAKLKAVEARIIEVGMKMAESKIDAAMESLSSVGESPAS